MRGGRHSEANHSLPAPACFMAVVGEMPNPSARTLGGAYRTSCCHMPIGPASTGAPMVFSF
jgi:hypothetical protein